MAVFLLETETGQQIPLNKAIILIGRHPDCDAVILGNPRISRQHCCIARVGDDFIIRDLHSTNGVRVNDQIIDDEVTLTWGDDIAIGNAHYSLQTTDPSELPS